MAWQSSPLEECEVAKLSGCGGEGAAAAGFDASLLSDPIQDRSRATNKPDVPRPLGRGIRGQSRKAGFEVDSGAEIDSHAPQKDSQLHLGIAAPHKAGGRAEVREF
jgi:hypothetical protein